MKLFPPLLKLVQKTPKPTFFGKPGSSKFFTPILANTSTFPLTKMDPKEMEKICLADFLSTHTAIFNKPAADAAAHKETASENTENPVSTLGHWCG